MIDKIEVIKEFQYSERKFGVYVINFNGDKEVIIRNGDSFGAVAFYWNKPVTKCVSTIRDDVKQKIIDIIEKER